MNEIYIIDGKKFRVGLINKDDFLQKNPTAKLFVEEEITEPEENCQWHEKDTNNA